MSAMRRGRRVDLLGRLERLERENRRLRVAGAVVAGLVVLAAAARQQRGDEGSYDVVKARRFVVVDATGAERGLLGMSDDTPRIALGPSLASPQLQIDAQPNQVDLALGAPGMPAAVNLSADADRGLVRADVLRGRLETAPVDHRDRD